METQGQTILVKFKSKPSGTDKLLRKGEGRREGKKTSMFKPAWRSHTWQTIRHIAERGASQKQ